ncbi:MAG: glycosyltransferase [Lachnospiraceae bacterium]
MKQEITIVICCYNGEEKLPLVIEHIYAQTSLENYVSEVIIVDNNSTDKTKNVIEGCAVRYNKIPIRYAFEPISGLSNARKRGVSECKTKWIAFLDDDNYVEKNWIYYIAKYIDENKSVGVFNGAVIPYVSFQMTDEENQRLKASLKVLACTHYNKEELSRNPKTPFRNPIGAGMVILAEPLKKLLGEGWLDSAGRTRDNLTSGEDGEMAFYIKNQGYSFGFCPEAVLEHHMSRVRLSEEYLLKMWYEIGRGVAVVAKKQHTSNIILILYRVFIEIRKLVYYMQNKIKGHFYSEYIRGYSHEIRK